MRLASTNGASASYSVNESYGLSHVFQFLFSGDATLWADATGGAQANVQALFLDDAAVTFLPPSPQNNSGTAPLPSLTGATMTGNGVFQLCCSNTQNASVTVLSTTNLMLPLTNWAVLGTATNIAPGLFQFAMQTMTNDPQRFFTIRSP
jgi:hypothetical protein